MKLFYVYILKCSDGSYYTTDPNIAIDFEKKLKGWSRRKKEALIKGDWDKLVAFSKNYTQFGKPKEDNE